MTHRSFAILLAFAPLNSAAQTDESDPYMSHEHPLVLMHQAPLQLVGPATGLTIGGLLGCVMVEITKLMATPMNFLTKSTFAGAGMVAGQVAQDRIANLDSNLKKALMEKNDMKADSVQLKILHEKSNIIVKNARDTMLQKQKQLQDMATDETTHDYNLKESQWIRDHTDEQKNMMRIWNLAVLNVTHDTKMKNITEQKENLKTMNALFRYWVDHQPNITYSASTQLVTFPDNTLTMAAVYKHLVTAIARSGNDFEMTAELMEEITDAMGQKSRDSIPFATSAPTSAPTPAPTPGPTNLTDSEPPNDLL